MHDLFALLFSSDILNNFLLKVWLIEEISGFGGVFLQWSYTATVLPKWKLTVFNQRNRVLDVSKIVCFHRFAKLRREDRQNQAPLAERQMTLWKQMCKRVSGNSHEGGESGRKCFSHCLHLITHRISQPSTQSLLKSAFTCAVSQELFICKTCLDSCLQADEVEVISGAQMCYQPCSARTRWVPALWWEAARGPAPALQTQHVSGISSPVFPSLIISFPGVAALSVSVKPKYFLATEESFWSSKWHCKQTDELPSTAAGQQFAVERENARQRLLLLICCAASRIEDSLLSVLHWRHHPQLPISLFPPAAKAIPVLTESSAPSLLAAAQWTSLGFIPGLHIWACRGWDTLPALFRQ